MIQQINAVSQLSCMDLKRDIYGRRIAAYLSAYGTQYPFCAAYLHTHTEGHTAILRFNSVVTISGRAADTDELSSFLNMLSPDMIEASPRIASALPVPFGMNVLKRTLFSISANPQLNNADEAGGQRSKARGVPSALDCSPKLDRVYEILKESFPDLPDFGMWLTDTSHRCRHGIGRVFLYKNYASASILFEDNQIAFMGEIATAPEKRGKGLARGMLRMITDMLAGEGKTPMLFAFPHRAGFYREIGFQELEDHIILMRDELSPKEEIPLFDDFSPVIC